MALIPCPDCGRQVSELAPACPGCGRPIATAPADPNTPKPGIIRANTDTLVTTEAPKSRPSALVWTVPVALVAALLGAGAVLLFTSRQPAPPQARAAPPTPVVLATAAPTPAVKSGTTNPSTVPGPQPPINGISCDALESTLVHMHVHLAVFIDGQEQRIPFGVGVGPPMEVSNRTRTRQPFVEDGACFYWLHTHTEDGVIHIESPVRRAFTLGDFFAVWQQPLSPTQIGPAQGDLIVYVNGERVTTNPADIELTQHMLIQINIRGDVPPYIFEFAPGD